VSPTFLEGKVLPLVASEVKDVFRSYKFQDFRSITVIEKNSGKMMTLER
jgi:hypothetical protein